MMVNNGVAYKTILDASMASPKKPYPENDSLRERLSYKAAPALPNTTLSFQLMTRSEPPELVMATIQSLLAVKQATDEILIIDNNNTDTSMYQPVAAFCASLDPALNVRFYHIDAVAGFKAGALNLALGLMNPHCSHLVVVDSDYQALPHARDSIANAIKQYPNHTLLQFPQFYRSAGQLDTHSELNHYFNHHLYRPFNRKRALSTGTYAVIRRSDLLSLGGWSGASITEDAQMGVLMHKRGFRSQFIPEVIATGLLPTSLNDLMCQRRRWIYGNMQVLSNYFSIAWPTNPQETVNTQSLSTRQTVEQISHPIISFNSSAISSQYIKNKGERLGYARAHLSQLSAWINFTGLFIFLQIATLFILGYALLKAQLSDATPDISLLTPLYLVYASYGVFIIRRLWAYLQDKAPLNKQLSQNHESSIKMRVRAWFMHLNFWELGALSWLPVLWGSEKPFVCTPKQEYIRTQSSLRRANVVALPKLILLLNIITAVIVAPFSPLYSPLLFICALIICTLKIGAAKVAFDNFRVPKKNPSSISIKSKPTVVLAINQSRKQTKSLKPLQPEIHTVFEDKKIINS